VTSSHGTHTKGVGPTHPHNHLDRDGHSSNLTLGDSNRHPLSEIGNEHIHIQGSQPRMYHSFQEYLQIMSLPSAYAGYIEIAAAQQLYGLNIVVVIAGNAFPAPPQQPPQHTLHVLFHPHSLHYSTLRPVIGQTPSP